MKLPWRRGLKLESSIDDSWRNRAPTMNSGWAFLGQVGYNLFVLVLIAILFGLAQQFTEYLAGRGEYRDAETDRIERQQRDLLCELIAEIESIPEDDRYRLSNQLDCAIPQLPDSDGELPSSQAPLTDSAPPADSTDTGSPSPGSTQQTDGNPAAGVTPPSGLPDAGAVVDESAVPTTVAPPVTPNRGTIEPTLPSAQPTAAPQSSVIDPSVAPQSDSSQDAGVVPGIDIQLCLPLIGCVNI